jgi:hypothetical protein
MKALGTLKLQGGITTKLLLNGSKSHSELFIMIEDGFKSPAVIRS